MAKKLFKVATIVLPLVIGILAIGILRYFPSLFHVKSTGQEQQARIIIPQGLRSPSGDLDNLAEQMAREDSMSSKIPLEDGEVLISVLNGYFEKSPVETQFIAYRNLLEIESPIYLTFIDYDEETRSYKRLWNAQTAASRPGTVNLYTQDLLGDQSVCVLLHGMNGQGQHTLTIFRKNTEIQEQEDSELFQKIAELRIDGTITVREIQRTAAQRAQNTDPNFTISAFGRDNESSNLLDQVEISYAYNRESGLFEETDMTRIPGSQVEQRRVRELLGNPRTFEEFVTGLWYQKKSDGTINKNQFIYFDPQSREIIFYGDETQQVFHWLASAATRYGLYVSSQNISVTTLKRSMDIELESLDSIRLRVLEDVRLKIGIETPWNGSYRKADPPENRVQMPTAANAHIDALYDGPIGKIQFLPNGSFQISSGNTLRQGSYAFFYFGDQELLELRSSDLRSTEVSPVDPRSGNISADNRETYLVEGEKTESLWKNLTLLRVRIGSKGIERLHERAITLTLTSE